jgi:hypothetical protein
MWIGAFSDGPRNSMEIEQLSHIQKAGSGEIESSLENLNPICLIRGAQSSE